MNDDALIRGENILSQYFGYAAFRDGQPEAVRAVIEGRDALVLMPTGGGKSICYQVPALARDGVAIVVSPLIALMKDQVEALRERGINAAYLNSSLSREESAAVIRDLRNGEIRLLYVAPERLLLDSTLALFQSLSLSLFAVDEAHCVAQWGHDFRPEYQRIREVTGLFPQTPVIALTATADERTREEIASALGLRNPERVLTSFDRPNITYGVTQENQAKDRLWDFLEAHHPHDSGIVYCLSRKKVEQTAEWLSEQGREAIPYHAGLPAKERDRNQERFLKEDNLIVVATIAFGMGIDKSNVRFVAHLSLPKSVEAYYQETGRAGRDGQPSSAWMNYGLSDVIMLRQMVEGSEGSEEFKRVTRHKLDAMLAFAETTECRRRMLLAYFGEESATQCGACDNCIDPPELEDATDDVRKALSAVYRCDQRFGVSHVIDVLCGSEKDNVIRRGHQRLSTYGIGKNRPRASWRQVFRQLIAKRYLFADIEGFGALKLTAEAKPVLRGEESVFLRKERIKSKSTRSSRAKRSAKRSTKSVENETPYSESLFEELRAVRATIAKEKSVPPYVIFHDKTLREMARSLPKNDESMLAISGVGPQKFARYGEAFLDVLRAH